ncbi:uncharacterized protein METZ01_LOCUS226493 [marine metagenome]|uniref:Uncharacterized protein n=1 Tax=marine metagenome TaxID=408172 RepID=A0A382GFE5_9ZZZZ
MLLSGGDTTLITLYTETAIKLYLTFVAQYQPGGRQMLGKILTYGSLLVALVAVLAPDAFGAYALILVALGLVSGFVNPIGDVTTRLAYYVLAATLPRISNELDAIPQVGSLLNSFLDQMAIVIAGVAIASFTLALMRQIKDA